VQRDDPLGGVEGVVTRVLVSEQVPPTEAGPPLRDVDWSPARQAAGNTITFRSSGISLRLTPGAAAGA
jgi:hypothetical protein